MDQGNDLPFSFLLFGTFQSNNERDGKTKLPSSLDDSFGDIITTHDTTKNVDKDALDFNV